ncbi:MAG TPA: S41 family peptidase [Blastocatellia bacterium]|nr:S41 family peptidase [Blastocatellia bacterium]
MRHVTTCLVFPIALAIILAVPVRARAQAFRDDDIARGRAMLDLIRKDIKKSYYDPAFHGIDVDARFKESDAQIQKATSNGQIFSIIAQTLVDFHDSHLYFIPPSRAARVEYGWKMRMIGDRCHVIAVKPGSDAAAKGLKPGDEIYSVDGFQPTRENFWLLTYLFYTLRPKPGLDVVIRTPEGQARELQISAFVRREKRVLNLDSEDGSDLNQLLRDAENEAEAERHVYMKAGQDVLVWKMPAFDLNRAHVDDIMDEAHGRKALIIDMRGNGGGYEETMLRLLGNLFEKDVSVGTIKRRSESKPLVAPTRGGDKVFKGTVIVLVDSRSGSAAELTARVLQLEKRGVVIGDRSAGAVMRARSNTYRWGVDTIVMYGASITDGDIVMGDGKSLENIGVTPDVLLLPTQEDMHAGRDPVLARALALAGLKEDAVAAGAMFPIEWEK